MHVFVVNLLLNRGLDNFNLLGRETIAPLTNSISMNLGASDCARLKPGNPDRGDCVTSDDLCSCRMAWARYEPRRLMAPQLLLGRDPTADPGIMSEYGG